MTKIRYKFIERIVLNIFKQFPHDKLKLPVDVNFVCSLFKNCKIWTYKQHSDFTGFSISEIAECLGSDSGCTLYDSNNDRYLILYNNQCLPQRNRWTCAHELAHILLGHFEMLNVDKIAEDDQYSFMEVEANYFASLLLCPFPIMKELNVKSPSAIETMCDLSNLAAQKCFHEFIKTPAWAYKCAYTNDVKRLFKPYIATRLCASIH